jgi:hypothetical protein
MGGKIANRDIILQPAHQPTTGRHGQRPSDGLSVGLTRSHDIGIVADTGLTDGLKMIPLGKISWPCLSNAD